ncbi:hypothetical protein AwPolaro_02320 [Polaromonas sp.]|nr:hypothetical protein AwPolaro_02320 [Polaromonas sp.]
MKINKQELISAGLVFGLGLVTLIGGQNYSMGTLGRMGPGYFPVMLGALLMIVSVLMLITGTSSETGIEEKQPPPEYRAWIFVISSVILFILLGKYAGLVPATFALVFLSALGDKTNTLRSAAALATGVTVLAVVVFSWLLQMQFPLFIWG